MVTADSGGSWSPERFPLVPPSMVNRNLIRSLESDEELNSLFQSEIENIEEEVLNPFDTAAGFEVNRIVEGRVIEWMKKSFWWISALRVRGTIPRHEWDEGDEPPKVGDVIKVLVEELEEDQTIVDETQGMIALSRRKCSKILHWQKMMEEIKEGQVVTGPLSRKIKGGLLVDVNGVKRPRQPGGYPPAVPQRDHIGLSRAVPEVLKIDEAPPQYRLSAAAR